MSSLEMGNVQQVGIQGEGGVSGGRRGWFRGSSGSSSTASSSSSSMNSSSSGMRKNDRSIAASVSAPAENPCNTKSTATAASEEALKLTFAPESAAAAAAAAVPTATLTKEVLVPFSPEEGRRELSRRWGNTTMFKRLEKERQTFLREALDGIVLVLPLEYADLDATEFLSAAHPPRPQHQQWQQQHQQQQGASQHEGVGDGRSCRNTSAAIKAGPSSSSSSSKNSKAARLLSRFPPSLLQYRAAAVDGVRWLVAIEGAPDTAYANDPFLLSFKFFPKYPIDSPELVFVAPFVPVHPHVYSNGHICLSILYDQWSPALGVKACCISLLSMLSSNREKQPPVDDRVYCDSRGLRGPKGVKWHFHDDTV